MDVLTVARAREMDRLAIEEHGMPGAVLMENAGRAIVEVIAAELGSLRGMRVAVVCGAGNNGGDGFVVARHAHIEGATVSVYLLAGAEALKGDAALNYRLLPVAGQPAPAGDTWTELRDADVIIDALLGTGSKGAPRDRYAEAIRAMNRSGKPIVAIDLPSGLDADTGAAAGEIVHARHTVTVIAPKAGMFLPPGAEHVGKLHVTHIGYPWDQLKQPAEMHYLYRPGSDPRVGPAPKRELPEVDRGPLRVRPAESNKGDFGHVGVVAGSRGMVGAPTMLARAAQRVGCGLVSVLSPQSAQTIIAGKLDEQMTIPLDEEDGAASPAAAAAILEFAKRATVFCMGPGMTTHPGTVELVQGLIRDLTLPLILDADGLNALAKQPSCAAQRQNLADCPLVITPHPGEAARLLGTSIAEVQSNRLFAVRELAHRYNAVAILKGSNTLTAAPEGPIWINGTGNPGMAAGGMGDVLTGVLGGLFAQWAAARRHGSAGCDIAPEELAALGVYIHGLAGDLAAGGIYAGLTAGDLIEQLPQAVHIMEESH